jgi:hypothetical protein
LLWGESGEKCGMANERTLRLRIEPVQLRGILSSQGSWSRDVALCHLLSCFLARHSVTPPEKAHPRRQNVSLALA